MEVNSFSYVSWAAWGVIQIEKLDRIQRRNYIKSIRASLPKNITLECGGSKQVPYYVVRNLVNSADTFAAAGEDGFQKVCRRILKWVDPQPQEDEDGLVQDV